MAMFERALGHLEDMLHLLGCLALVGIAVVINADILLRLFADYPVQFQFELTEIYLMPMLATLSLSRVFRDGAHLSLEILAEDQLDPSGYGLVRRAILLLGASFFAAVTWASGHFALRAFARGAIEYGSHDWPLGWAYAAIPVGCGVLALRLVVEAAKRGAASAQS